jgi:hypothetical protein
LIDSSDSRKIDPRLHKYSVLAVARAGFIDADFGILLKRLNLRARRHSILKKIAMEFSFAITSLGR